MTQPSKWTRTPLAVRVGLIFAAAGIVLALVGIVKGAVPANPLSVLLALLISGGSWFVVSWAVTTAIVDVERDAAEVSDSGEGA